MATATITFDFFANAEQIQRLVQVLPTPVRLYYLNRLFNEPTEDCFNCYSQLVGALRALDNNASEHGADYGFDQVRLLPLLRQGEGYIREPVSALACNLILMNPDERVFNAMAQQFSQDPVSLRACLEGRPSLFKQEHPAEYELARKALRKVARLAVYADAVPPTQ